MARGKSGRNARRFIKSHIADAFRSDDMEQFIGRVPEAFKMTPRRWQSSAIDRLRAGDNVMVKAGTGSGKSFLFEVMTHGPHQGQSRCVDCLSCEGFDEETGSCSSLAIGIHFSVCV